jgi:hypothetical protein
MPAGFWAIGKSAAGPRVRAGLDATASEAALPGINLVRLEWGRDHHESSTERHLDGILIEESTRSQAADTGAVTNDASTGP